jgi:hypothetical protein
MKLLDYLLKDLDDFILSLIRNPAFSEKVFECGNSLHQPVLDRYIAGEDVAFTEVRKVGGTPWHPRAACTNSFEDDARRPTTLLTKKRPTAFQRGLGCSKYFSNSKKVTSISASNSDRRSRSQLKHHTVGTATTTPIAEHTNASAIERAVMLVTSSYAAGMNISEPLARTQMRQCHLPHRS